MSSGVAAGHASSVASAPAGAGAGSLGNPPSPETLTRGCSWRGVDADAEVPKAPNPPPIAGCWDGGFGCWYASRGAAPNCGAWGGGNEAAAGAGVVPPAGVEGGCCCCCAFDRPWMTGAGKVAKPPAILLYCMAFSSPPLCEGGQRRNDDISDVTFEKRTRGRARRDVSHEISRDLPRKMSYAYGRERRRRDDKRECAPERR